MNSWNLPRVRELLLECGAVALGYFGKTEMNLKDDKTIVTQADRAVEQLLARHFDRPDEGAYMIGEETVEQRDERYIDEAMRGIAWVVDPIDGTAPYAHRMPHWGVSIGYMEGGGTAGRRGVSAGDRRTVRHGRGARCCTASVPAGRRPSSGRSNR